MPKSITVTGKNDLGLEIGLQTVLDEMADAAVSAKIAHYSKDIPPPKKKEQ
jgi:hypothetical protein